MAQRPGDGRKGVKRGTMTNFWLLGSWSGSMSSASKKGRISGCRVKSLFQKVGLHSQRGERDRVLHVKGAGGVLANFEAPGRGLHRFDVAHSSGNFLNCRNRFPTASHLFRVPVWPSASLRECEESEAFNKGLGELSKTKVEKKRWVGSMQSMHVIAICSPKGNHVSRAPRCDPFTDEAVKPGGPQIPRKKGSYKRWLWPRDRVGLGRRLGNRMTRDCGRGREGHPLHSRRLGCRLLRPELFLDQGATGAEACQGPGMLSPFHPAAICCPRPCPSESRDH